MESSLPAHLRSEVLEREALLGELQEHGKLSRPSPKQPPVWFRGRAEVIDYLKLENHVLCCKTAMHLGGRACIACLPS